MVRIRAHHLIKNFKKKEIELDLSKETCLKEILNAIGVPEDDVGMVIVNGRWRQKDCIIKDNDAVELFPYMDGG
ncbi:MAG: MoaD/ThiS family protein [Tepidanaerobacteraceae bacterium]|jgi:molybdopterin converting factor small subunit|nr:MoaD/ThiS family protein [Tepidanaerobacteraceae bacterium]